MKFCGEGSSNRGIESSLREIPQVLTFASEAPLNARGLCLFGGSHAEICIRLICGIVDAVRGSFHSRGHDGYCSVRPSFRCRERLANRHSGMSRGRTWLQIRTDFGMPSASWLLVCPLLAVKVEMQKGRQPKRAPRH